MSKSIFKNTIYKMILSVFNLLVPLLVTPYIAGLFARDEGTKIAYGIYNDANNLMGIFLIFAVFGVYNYGVREISKIRNDKERVASTFSNLFLFSIITSLLTSLLYSVYVIFSVEPKFYPTYFIMLIQLSGNFLSVEWMNEAAENYGYITKKTIVVRILYFISIFVFVRTPDDIVPFGLVMSLSVFVNNLVSFIHIKRSVKFNFTDLHLSRYVKPLLILVLINNVNILYMQLDKYLLGHGPAANPIAVTEYTMPANAINMIGVMLTSLLMVSVPRLSYYVSHGEHENYMALLNKSTRGFFLILCPSCVGLACLSYEAMYLYTSGAYAYAYPVMTIFALRFLINSLYSIFTSQILYIWGRERAMIKILAFGGVLNALFDFALIGLKLFTPASAVLTTAVAELIMLSVMYRYIRRKTPVNFKLLSYSNLKYLLFSLPFFVIAFAVKSFKLGVLPNCLIIIPSCALIYLFLLVITKDDMLLYFADKLKNKLKRR